MGWRIEIQQRCTQVVDECVVRKVCHTALLTALTLSCGTIYSVFGVDVIGNLG